MVNGARINELLQANWRVILCAIGIGSPQLGGEGGGRVASTKTVAVVVPAEDDENENEVTFDDWADILWMQQATFDAPGARKAWNKKRFAADFKPEYGNSFVFTEAWISSFENFGPLQQSALWPTYRLRQLYDTKDKQKKSRSMHVKLAHPLRAHTKKPPRYITSAYSPANMQSESRFDIIALSKVSFIQGTRRLSSYNGSCRRPK